MIQTESLIYGSCALSFATLGRFFRSKEMFDIDIEEER